jgi:sec-independent protein translocase protein TatA
MIVEFVIQLGHHKEISMNNLFLFGVPTGWELILILVIVLVLFGAKRLPELAKGMGESIRNFKHGMTEAEAEDEKKKHGMTDAEAEYEKKDKAKAA